MGPETGPNVRDSRLTEAAAECVDLFRGIIESEGSQQPSNSRHRQRTLVSRDVVWRVVGVGVPLVGNLVDEQSDSRRSAFGAKQLRWITIEQSLEMRNLQVIELVFEDVPDQS